MLDFNSILSRVLESVAVGLSEGATIVAERARQHAPIRKVFGGGRRQMRFLSVAEHEQIKGMRSALGLQAFGSAGPPRALRVASQHVVNNFSASSKRRQFATVVTRGNSANMNVPAMRALGSTPGTLWSPRAEQHLTRRGKSELKSMRANYKGSLGGRLRGEIYVVPATVGGKTVKAMVVSPTSYAKYQEFGTRHHPAHPFMRPAAEESGGQVVKAVRASLGPALAAGVPGRGRVVIRYTMKAGG